MYRDLFEQRVVMMISENMFARCAWTGMIRSFRIPVLTDADIMVRLSWRKDFKLKAGEYFASLVEAWKE